MSGGAKDPIARGERQRCGEEREAEGFETEKPGCDSE